VVAGDTYAVKIESTAFTPADLDGFMDELLERERLSLIGRLESDSERLGRLVERIPAQGAPAEGWTAVEILAHIAVLSKFYGVLVYKIGSGQMEELDLIGNVHLRDVMGARLAELPPAQLLEMAQTDHRRTIDFLKGAGAAELRRRASTGEGAHLTAGEIARLPLIAHLEGHLDQLHAALE
jgi:hypothetical protein